MGALRTLRIPGEGTADWAKICAHLDALGYEGFISVELEDFRYHPTWEAVDKTEEVDHNSGTITLMSPPYTEDIALRLILRNNPRRRHS